MSRTVLIIGILITCVVSVGCESSLQLKQTAAGLPSESKDVIIPNPGANAAEIEQQQLFPASHGRFPNITVTVKGTVLATFGRDGMVARRSEDGGETWGEIIRVSEAGIHGGGLTVDETTGDIIAFTEEKHPPARMTQYRSVDDGKTWTKEQPVLKPDSKGNMPSMHMNESGITLRRGEHAGRLLRATRFYGEGNDRQFWDQHYTNAMYSDDGGRTWQTSEPFPENGTGEAAVAELSDGTIYYNSRVHWPERPTPTRRRSAYSYDSGHTWSDWRIQQELPDGQQTRAYGCMGGLVRLPVRDRDLLVFSNLDTSNARRERISIWFSDDGGQTWGGKTLVYEGASAYSSMAAGRPGTPSEGWIYLHYEGGPNGGSRVARFSAGVFLESQDSAMATR